jgi:hypothetical protein
VGVNNLPPPAHESDRQYYERLMGRGYTEEQAELAVLQRAQQTNNTPQKVKVTPRVFASNYDRN